MADAPQSADAWRFGDHKPERHWQRQLDRRGWTVEQISEAIADGEVYSAINNLRPGNRTSRYVHPRTGRSVVLDEETREVLHVGGDGFQY